MSIYSKNGVLLSNVFGVSGANLVRAYSKSGEVVFSKQIGPDYNNPTITNIGGSVAASNTQGVEAYDGILFVWNGGNTLRLYNLATSSLESISSITTTISSHGNDLSFSTEFYSESDEFPLLYVNASQCLRIQHNGNTWSATYLWRLRTPGVYGMEIADAFDGNTLITIGYSEAQYTYTDTNKLIIAKWDMTDLTDNGDGTYTPKLLTTVTRDWLECLQGASYHDGYLWVASGLGNTGNKGHIYALNTNTGAIAFDIDTGDTREIEGLAWAYSNADGWYMVFGQVGIGFRKITFQNNQTGT